MRGRRRVPETLRCNSTVWPETQRTLRWEQGATNLQLQRFLATKTKSGVNRQGGEKPRSRHGRIKAGASIPKATVETPKQKWTLGSMSSGGRKGQWPADSAAMRNSSWTTANPKREWSEITPTRAARKSSEVERRSRGREAETVGQPIRRTSANTLESLENPSGDRQG